MLMFSKTSIQSFLYDMIDVFMFPNEDIQKIYENYEIQKCFFYQNLTVTDSTSLFFVFIGNLSCSIDEKRSRDITFKVLIKSKLLERLDLSDDFWERFNLQNKTLRKKLVYMK